MVGYALPDGTWKAVWNHNDGQTQHLGRWIIRKVKTEKGDLEAFQTKYIEDCPEGWSSLRKGERSEDPVGFLGGTFDGIVASCNPEVNKLCYDSHYLYLFYPPKRRLYVFEVREGTMRPFGMVTFDETGAAKPKRLPPVEE
jgi:hypothetical protein